MFSVDAKPELEQLSRALSELGSRQLPFVLALAATRTAQRVKKGELSVIRKRLDRPTNTTMNSLFVKSATKQKPEARAFFKDAFTSGIPADTYMQAPVKGGVRRHKRFEKALIAKGVMKKGQYAIPSKAVLNQYGNVSRGVITKLLSGIGAAETSSGFQANATGSKRSKRKGNADRYFAGEIDGTAGVWERRKSAFGDAVRPVFIFTDAEPKYRVIVPFFKIAENIVKANYMAELTSALDHAIKTARK